MKKFYLFALMAMLCIVSAIAQPISVTTLNVPYTQDFNSLLTSSTSNVLPAGWYLVETGSGAAANGFYIAGTGSGTGGDTYSFGSPSSTERALGMLRSGTVVPTIGAGFTNTSGASISALQISYQAEQWRLGAIRTGTNDRIDFQISYDATAINNGTWINVDELDFTSPIGSGTVGALNGNAAANSATRTFEITGLSIASGQSFFVRWVDFDVPSSDDGLAVDDFSITPIGATAEPSISFSSASLSFGDVNAGETKVVSYEAIGANLSGDITITSDNALFTLSADNISFSSSLVVPSTGSMVYVAFAPTANGSQTASLSHSAGTYSRSINVSGFGFVQAENIIPIATARQKVPGTKVTVAGRITVANEHGNPAFIQDETGGIPVFDATLASSVQIGDSVVVTGPISLFNEQKQISGAGIFFTEVVTDARIIEPKLISLSEMAANEGLLVKIENVALVNKSFVFYPQSTERLTDGAVQADLRIDGDTDIPGLAKPQGAFDVIGVVGRFRANAQLLPRFQPDIPAAVEPTTPSDSIARELTFDVVSWNFEFFGARSEDYGNEEYGPADEALQLANIKQVLESLNADVIAVQEVSDEAYFAQLVSQLGNHSYVCSQRFSYSFEGPGSDFPPQKVCFIYDTRTVAVESARPMFESLYDEARTSNPSLLPSYPTGDPSSFWSSGRLPFLVNAKATIQGVEEKVSFVVLHAKSGATVADFNRRVYDAHVLKDSLDAHFADKQVIVLGDLNDDLDQSIVSGKPSSYLNFVIDGSYLAITKPLSEAGARSTVSFQDVIDHQIITSELADEYIAGSANIIAPFRTIDNYANTTSDHLPVISRYLFVAPVLNFVSADATVSEEAGSLDFTISLSKPFADNRSLSISLTGDAANGADFTTASGNGTSILVPVNAGATTATFTVTVTDDLLDELTESVTFTLDPNTGVEVDNASVTLTIEDNDRPTISFVKAYAQVLEGSSTLVTLKLSTAVSSDQVVTISITEDKKADYGVDYTTSPAASNLSLTVPVHAGSDEVSFEFQSLADKKKEALELVTFKIVGTTPGLEATSPIISVVGIENVKKHPLFMIYPNPTQDLINLVAQNVDQDEIFSLELREPNGKLVVSASATLNELNEQIRQSLSNRRKGLYTLTIVYGEEVIVLRIVKL